MFSDDTRGHFIELMDSLRWDMKYHMSTRIKRRLRFHGCRPAPPRGPLAPYSLDVGMSGYLFPTPSLLRAFIPPTPAKGRAVEFRPIAGVLTSDDIAAVAERTHAIMRDKMDDLERGILSGGLL